MSQYIPRPSNDFSGAKVLHVGKWITATDTRGLLSPYNSWFPFSTISAALSAKSTGDIVLVHPGTYDEQVTINSGDILYFEAGAVMNFTGSGGTFKTGVTPGQVKIYGNGRLYHSGLATSQHVFDISDASIPSLWHIDVNAEDVRTMLGQTELDGEGHYLGLGTEFADSDARDAAVPAHVGDYGFQRDTLQKYISTGTSAGNWTELDATTIKVNSGYIKLRCHSIEGINADAIRVIDGEADFRSERLVGSGYGCNAYNGGKDDGGQSFNFVWVQAFRIEVDRNEVAIYFHGSVNGGTYFSADTIFGSFIGAGSNNNVWLTAKIMIPHYDGPSEDGHTTQPWLVNLKEGNGTYYFDVKQMTASTAGLIRVGCTGRIYFHVKEGIMYTPPDDPAVPLINIANSGGGDNLVFLNFDHMVGATDNTLVFGPEDVRTPEQLADPDNFPDPIWEGSPRLVVNGGCIQNRGGTPVYLRGLDNPITLRGDVTLLGAVDYSVNGDSGTSVRVQNAWGNLPVNTDNVTQIIGELAVDAALDQ